MIKVLTIGSDRNLFKKDSRSRERIAKQGAIFSELHIIVFSLSSLNLKIEKISENVWIYPTNSRSRLSYIKDAIFLSKKIAAEHNINPSETVVSAQDPFEAGLAAYLIARNLTIPLHIQVHTDFLSPYFRRQSIINRIRVGIARSILPKATGVRVVSRRLAESIDKSGIKLSVKPVILPVFTDIALISNGVPTFDLHEKYPDFKFIILVMGRLSSEKNISFALRVLAVVGEKRPDVGMVIVGDGPQKGKLLDQAKSYALGKRIAFEPWQENLVSFYKTANMLLFTSKYEGYGLVLIEAAAAGCPILTTDVGIAREILVNNYEQFVCPVGDEQCFVAKIFGLLTDNNLRRQYSTDLSLWASNHKFPNVSDYLKDYQKMMEDCLKKND